MWNVKIKIDLNLDFNSLFKYCSMLKVTGCSTVPVELHSCELDSQNYFFSISARFSSLMSDFGKGILIN